MRFTRDPAHWLRKLSPDEWIRAALGEAKRAEEAFARHDTRAGVASVKRAAGMALNGALLVEPDQTWGRSYVDHVRALSRDERAPEAVRVACHTVLDVPAPGGDVVVLRTRRSGDAGVEAAKDIIAHAWTIVRRHESKG